jgi:hypothetical protein
VTAGWVAASVRAVGLAQRQVGAGKARDLAMSGSLAAAQRVLTESPYRRGVRVGATLADTEFAVSATLLWDMRILAGWQPGTGAQMIRTLAGGFEVANIGALAAALAGGTEQPWYDPGSLNWAWPRLREARSLAELRAALRDSTWGDPGGETARDIVDGVLLAWAARVAAGVGDAAAWAAGAAALVLARRIFLQATPLPAPAARRGAHLLGAAALAATDPQTYRAALPSPARWALTGVDTADDLWRAEFAWWRRVASDGRQLLGGLRFGPSTAVGAVAVLAADAWRVRAALQVAAGSSDVEDFDELV